MTLIIADLKNSNNGNQPNLMLNSLLIMTGVTVYTKTL